MSNQKAFASTGDVAEKKISFTEIGPGLYAFTAEGDPNTGAIVGDDCCAVFDAQATPAMAHSVVRKVREVTDKPIRYVILSHYHAVRVLAHRASIRRASSHRRRTHRLIAERGQQDWQSEYGRFPRLFRDADSSRPHLADARLQRRNDALSREASGEAFAIGRGPHFRRYRCLGSRRERDVFGRSHRVPLSLLLRRRASASLARHFEPNSRFRSEVSRAGTRRRLERAAHSARSARDDAGFRDYTVWSGGNVCRAGANVEGNVRRNPRRDGQEIWLLRDLRALPSVQCRSRLR